MFLDGRNIQVIVLIKKKNGWNINSIRRRRRHDIKRKHSRLINRVHESALSLRDNNSS